MAVYHECRKPARLSAPAIDKRTCYHPKLAVLSLVRDVSEKLPLVNSNSFSTLNLPKQSGGVLPRQLGVTGGLPRM